MLLIMDGSPTKFGVQLVSIKKCWKMDFFFLYCSTIDMFTFESSTFKLIVRLLSPTLPLSIKKMLENGFFFLYCSTIDMFTFESSTFKLIVSLLSPTLPLLKNSSSVC
jgi:hypothetical protein